MTDDIQPSMAAPFYRRLWVVTLLTLFFFPLAMLILLTGNVYRREDGQTRPIGNGFRYAYGGVLAAFLGLIVVGIFTNPKTPSQHWAETADKSASNSPAKPASSGPAEHEAAPVSNADWALKSTTNALDGDRVVASKTFDFPDQKSQLDVSLTCNPQTSDIEIRIESYGDTPEDGKLPANAFVTHSDSNGGVVPTGRIKFGKSDPQTLFNLFHLANYTNVMSFAVLDYAKYTTNDSHTGAGNFLGSNLPVVIEVNNETGAEQIAIPSGNGGLNTVFEKCSVSSNAEAAPSQPTSDANGQTGPAISTGQ